MHRSRSASVKRRKADTSGEGDTSLPNTQSTSTPKPPKRQKKQKVINLRLSQPSIVDSFLRKYNEVSDSLTASGGEDDDLNTMSGTGFESCDSDMEVGECSNKDLMSVLLAVRKELKSVNRKFDSLALNVEKLEGEVFDLKQENDNVKKQLKACEKMQENTESRLHEAHYYAKLAYDRAEANEQYSRRNNVKLLYIEEPSDHAETGEESEEKVLKVFHDKLKLTNIKPWHIEAAHRVGKRKAGLNRPIIVKFVSRKNKREVIQNRRLLKNVQPKVVIVEDLTKSRYILFQCTLDHPGTREAWTSEGSIFAKDAAGAVHRVERVADLSRLPPIPENDPAAASTPAQRRFQQRKKKESEQKKQSDSAKQGSKDKTPDKQDN
ncbi:uncharacterized protein [Littorina saxatilis]|uniref:uncharacterized protein n=1 Tax=Littorina saxatilis TaxID=31220 RepID=UPI0038B4AC7F